MQLSGKLPVKGEKKYTVLTEVITLNSINQRYLKKWEGRCKKGTHLTRRDGAEREQPYDKKDALIARETDGVS